uniref:Alanine--glyoxylate aminotransferase 2, mitochondrial n=1 Tax=Hirondellea gigas TaxID=1518452 RepID=A0A6A7G3V5_9CRUS
MSEQKLNGAISVQIPKTDFVPRKYEGPSTAEVVSLRRQYMNPGIFAYYKKPLMLVEGNGQYVYDEEGKQYLDTFAGIVTISVGHCHPKVVAAGQKQLETIMHTTTIYYNPEVALLAKELISKMPEGSGLNRVYFTNSGSEANDLAVLMSRMYTGAYDMISLRNGYHGMSEGMRGLTALKNWKFAVPQAFGVHHALNPNRYRGPFGYDDPDSAHKYANDVKDLIDHATPGKIACYIAECIQGVGGTVVLPDGYLKEVYKHVRDAGGLCIADEVQTGFGRTGTHYWGFEGHGVIPDIVVVAKGMGNGTPIAAVITREDVAMTMKTGLHFNTYGGNPVSCAIARAVLKIIDEENIQQNAYERGEQYMEGLLKLQKKYDFIGDVRGKGLMIGLEMVKDRVTKEPAVEETLQVMERCRDMGLLIGRGGLLGNVFRIKPPMCISEADVVFALDVMDRAFGEL